MSDDKKEFEKITCCSCGVVFCLSMGLNDIRKNDHNIFYCPNGHGQSYSAPKEDPKDNLLKKLRLDLAEVSDKADKLQKEVDTLKNELDIWRLRSAVSNDTEMPGEKAI